MTRFLPTELDSSNPAPVDQELVEMGNRKRLYVPARLTTNLPWASSGNCLGIFDVPGRFFLASWESHSAAILERRNTFLKQQEFELLLLLQDRYRLITLPKEVRLTLTGALLAHLGVLESAPLTLYVSRIDARIEIASQEFRDARLAKAQSTFRDLP
jgi:hypothetical protein